MLRPSSSPSIFSIVPQPPLAPGLLGAEGVSSQDGYWLTLDLSSGGTFTLPTPRQAAVYGDLNPRDRWVRNTIDAVAWWWTKRFTLCTSVSAHLALDVTLDVVGPEDALQRGGVEWKAELVETKDIAPSAGVGAGPSAIPNHAVISSVVPRQTAAPKLDAGKEETIVFAQSKDTAVRGEILASDTIDLEQDAASAPYFPCPRVYLHVVVRQSGVPIPPPTVGGLSTASKWAPVFRLAERVFGPLAGDNTAKTGHEGGGSAPIHITLERLYLGGVPATAVGLVAPMAVMLLVGWWGVRPLLEASLPRAAAGKRGKAE